MQNHPAFQFPLGFVLATRNLQILPGRVPDRRRIDWVARNGGVKSRDNPANRLEGGANAAGGRIRTRHPHPV